jgi:CDP-glucose 4,6-dehydratase
MESEIGDIRNFDSVRRSMVDFRPDLVIHMAAQPLVRLSYLNPIETYSTNVMGTAHVLEAVRSCSSARVVVVITSDKCYENREWVWGYRETEPMGGHDPYSSSKACTELLAQAYQRSFLRSAGVALATCRAGNVIGGGDWAQDRLVPDCLRAFSRGDVVLIRNPHAVRPWQHVLEPLGGYLLVAEKMWVEPEVYSESWNFGPNDADAQPVSWLVDRLVERWQHTPGWMIDGDDHPHEAHFLKLDTSKARQRLNWKPRWNLERSLRAITDWHSAEMSGVDMRAFTLGQIAAYVASPLE